MNRFIARASGSLMALLGIFLILDSVIFNALTLDYGKFGLSFLDPYISHFWWGLIFLSLGYSLLFLKRGGR